MQNKMLKYLLSNDPNKCITKLGISIRKIINPLFRNIMMLSTNGKIIIDNNNTTSNKKIIYAGTHGFHDDIIFTIKTINNHAYLLYGNLLDFFKTFHGFGLWINGVILVDRTNKESRKSSIQKMIKVLNNNGNIVMFPEGTWNMDDSLVVGNLHLGIYEVAEKTKAKIVPVATYLDGNKAYSKQGETFDITCIDNEKILIIINNNIKLIKKCIDLLIYDGYNERNIKSKLLLMLDRLDSEPNLSLIDNISLETEKILKELKAYKATLDKNSINYSIMDRIEITLKMVIRQKRIVMVDLLRDKMATLKWDLYTDTTHDTFKKGYWKEYTDKLISTTNGMYNYEEENISRYNNPLNISDRKVFSILDDIEITNENAKTLILTKNNNLRSEFYE